jgi:phosphate transport system permease protein
MRRRHIAANLSDWAFRNLTLLFAAAIAGLVLVMIVEMGLNSSLSFERFGLSLLWRSKWDPVREEFGALPFIYGTVVSSAIALLLAAPVSISVAIFLVEQAPRHLSDAISFIIQLLAAIPSVIYGLWGMFVLAPFLRDHVYPNLQSWLGFLPIFQGNINGLGLLTAGVILSIMIVPIITAITVDVLKAVPDSQREAALALGATEWEKAMVALRYARPGIIGAVMLGLGRAIGETMAVTMVIGNRPEISIKLFDPSFTIASAIANEFTEATSEIYRHALVELGLILFLITFLINALARLFVLGVARGRERAAAYA